MTSFKLPKPNPGLSRASILEAERRSRNGPNSACRVMITTAQKSITGAVNRVKTRSRTESKNVQCLEISFGNEGSR